MESRDSIRTETTNSFPTNNKKEITAQILRQFQEIINLSKFNLVDDTLADIQVSNTDLGGNAEDAITNVYDTIYGDEKAVFGAIPLFYIDVDSRYRDRIAQVDLLNLEGFSSNNPTAMVVETDRDNRDNNFVFSWSESYGSTNIFVVLYGDGFATNATTAFVIEPIAGGSSYEFTVRSRFNLPPEVDTGTTATYTSRVYFFGADLNYVADL